MRFVFVFVFINKKKLEERRQIWNKGGKKLKNESHGKEMRKYIK